jgi:hypothetical protein
MINCLGPGCKQKIEDKNIFCSLNCAIQSGCYDNKKGWNMEKCFVLALKNKRYKVARQIKYDAENPKYLPSITKEMIDNPPFSTPKTKEEAIQSFMSLLKEVDLEVLKRVPHTHNLEIMEDYTGKAINLMFKIHENDELISSCLGRQINKTLDESSNVWLIIITEIWKQVNKKECKACKITNLNQSLS